MIYDADFNRFLCEQFMKLFLVFMGASCALWLLSTLLFSKDKPEPEEKKPVFYLY